MNRPQLLLLGMLLFMLFIAGARQNAAQERPQAGAKQAGQGNVAPAARSQDEKAIRAASQAFAKAFESGDAQSVTLLFTEEAEYIDEEREPIRGRAALAEAYKKFFADRKEMKAESKTDTVRFLGENTAVEEGTFTVTAKDSPPQASRFSALHVREDGKWMIALLKEWSDETTSKPSLEDLAWLIGTWENEGDELAARTTYEWTADKTFIRAHYTVTPKNKKPGERASSGTQVIGIDPAEGFIRGWLFASDGGIAESTWGWDGQRWVIESLGTLADGTHTSAINFLTRNGDDSFTWRSAQRTLAGETQPDLAPVTVRRVAAAAPRAGKAARFEPPLRAPGKKQIR